MLDRAELNESFRMAMHALSAHKLRSGLTVLGVLVGVFSIIVVMTAMRVLQRNVEGELRQLGGETFAVQKWPGIFFGGSEGFEKYWRRKNITQAQGELIRDRATLAANVGLEQMFWAGQVSSRYENSAPEAQLFGSTPGCFPAKNWILREGRPILETDVANASDFCVLGAGLAQTLFPHASPLGERVKLDGVNYVVVGALESHGARLGGDQDNFAIIPLTTGLNRFGRTWRSLTVLVQAPSRQLFDETVEQVRGILRAARKVPPGQEDDFEIFSNESLIAQFNSITGTVRIGVAVVSSIALLAAGIGIMNIMLVAVTERTREIGIRRAVGAKKRNILTQFIIEAVILCQVGGILGVVLGILGGNTAAMALKLPVAIPLDWAALGLLLCSIVGVVFGTYPAFKAANLDPIESLRYE